MNFFEESANGFSCVCNDGYDPVNSDQETSFIHEKTISEILNYTLLK